MKLQPIFTLYHRHYPSSTVYRIVIGGPGDAFVTLYDASAAHSLSVMRSPWFACYPSPRDEEERRLLLSFCLSNRRELFAMREARNLSGILLAENMSSELSFMSLCSGLERKPRSEERGLRLTWLFPLATILASRRYALRAVTLLCNGTTYLDLRGRYDVTAARIRRGGKAEAFHSLDRSYRAVTDSAALRYVRLYVRDSAAALGELWAAAKGGAE